ncbi:ATP-binding protein [Haloarcula nitratireducens]|uniref:histidine kinase n=1 Tax=Haloarcula nitratireducens TaxID=2487749 RepID=A0AAW4PI16_9EURY|nr:ATP-binding protein [Halomicroarcula nitratireducens]MBX0297624.1 histidine kinase [Halomicroarcula nitratireducens]
MATNLLYGLYIFTFAAAALGCFLSLPRLRRVRDRDTRWGLLTLVGTSGGWAAAQVGFLIAPTIALKLGSYVVGLVLGFAAVGAWLYFCSAYTGRGYHHNSPYRRLAFVVFIMVVAVKITNPLHHEYFTTTIISTPFPHLSVHTGPLHWPAMGLSYALAFVGFFMLLELFTAVDYDTRPLGVLVGLTGLPVVFDIVGYATPYLIDMTYEPLGVAVFALGVAFVHLDRFEAVRLAAERDTPIIALDQQERVRDTNQAAHDLFPALDTARGQHLRTVLPSVAACLQRAEPILKLEQNNQTRYFHVTQSPFSTAKAGLGRTIVFTDVTERERYRTELERQNQRLEQFASMVSHDLRNPLTVAQGRLELARETLDSEDEDLSAVHQALVRMDTLIDEVLSLARHGQPVDETEKITLSTITADSWAMVATAEADLTIAADVTFAGDRKRLQRLFENLFRNAIDHAGTDVAITVGSLDDHGFYVEDNGPGIPSPDREHVFEPGFTTQSGGTGFGLAIVAEIVAAHGWNISITETDAGGARFEISGIESIAEA